jgi:hypothetical protein
MLSESELKRLRRKIGLSFRGNRLHLPEVRFLERHAENLSSFGLRAHITTIDLLELERIFKKALPGTDEPIGSFRET